MLQTSDVVIRTQRRRSKEMNVTRDALKLQGASMQITKESPHSTLQTDFTGLQKTAKFSSLSCLCSENYPGDH